MEELETILKVLGEKIKALELTISCNEYTIDNLKKENKELQEKLKETSENE